MPRTLKAFGLRHILLIMLAAGFELWMIKAISPVAYDPSLDASPKGPFAMQLRAMVIALPLVGAGIGANLGAIYGNIWRGAAVGFIVPAGVMFAAVLFVLGL